MLIEKEGAPLGWGGGGLTAFSDSSYFHKNLPIFLRNTDSYVHFNLFITCCNKTVSRGRPGPNVFSEQCIHTGWTVLNLRQKCVLVLKHLLYSCTDWVLDWIILLGDREPSNTVEFIPWAPCLSVNKFHSNCSNNYSQNWVSTTAVGWSYMTWCKERKNKSKWKKNSVRLPESINKWKLPWNEISYAHHPPPGQTTSI